MGATIVLVLYLLVLGIEGKQCIERMGSGELKCRGVGWTQFISRITNTWAARITKIDARFTSTRVPPTGKMDRFIHLEILDLRNNPIECWYEPEEKTRYLIITDCGASTLNDVETILDPTSETTLETNGEMTLETTLETTNKTVKMPTTPKPDNVTSTPTESSRNFILGTSILGGFIAIAILTLVLLCCLGVLVCHRSQCGESNNNTTRAMPMLYLPSQTELPTPDVDSMDSVETLQADSTVTIFSRPSHNKKD